MNARPSNSGGDRRFTLPATLDKVLALAGLRAFTLDPCADRLSSACALTCYFAESDGLSLPWMGDVFVNPPWSDIGPWVEKGIAEVVAGHSRSVTYLLPDNRQGTRWWQKHIEPVRDRKGEDPNYASLPVFRYTVSTHYLAGRPRYGSPEDPAGARAKTPPFGGVVLKFERAYKI